MKRSIFKAILPSQDLKEKHFKNTSTETKGRKSRNGKIVFLFLFFLGSISPVVSQMIAPEGTILTSIKPLEKLIKMIVKKKYKVRSLLSSGADPHTYEVKPRDFQFVSVYVPIGLEIDVLYLSNLARSGAENVLVPYVLKDVSVIQNNVKTTPIPEHVHPAASAIRKAEHDSIHPHPHRDPLSPSLQEIAAHDFPLKQEENSSKLVPNPGKKNFFQVLFEKNFQKDQALQKGPWNASQDYTQNALPPQEYSYVTAHEEWGSEEEEEIFYPIFHEDRALDPSLQREQLVFPLILHQDLFLRMNKTQPLDIFETPAQLQSLMQSFLQYDPHLWFSPLRMLKIARNLTQFFQEIDAKNEAFYEANFLEVERLFKGYQTYLLTQLASVKNNYLFAYHASFAYFALDYDLHEFYLEGKESEIGFSELRQFYELLKKSRSKKMIFEEGIPPVVSVQIKEHFRDLKPVYVKSMGSSFFKIYKQLAQGVK